MLLRPLFCCSLILALGACAPRVQTRTLPVTDPVFAPGQVWSASWGDGTATLLTVPGLVEARDGTFRYSSPPEAPQRIYFSSDPEDSDPSFVHVAYVDFSPSKEHHCVVRNPGTGVLDDVKLGMYSPQLDASEFAHYVRTGNPGGKPICSLIRRK